MNKLATWRDQASLLGSELKGSPPSALGQGSRVCFCLICLFGSCLKTMFYLGGMAGEQGAKPTCRNQKARQLTYRKTSASEVWGMKEKASLKAEDFEE